jgi:4-amino-4-deoxy-L-arabinose transferase-like glycosyltransferase
MQKTTGVPPYLIIAVTAVLLFIPFLGSVHLFDWDEINFAECAREMLVSGDYLRVQIDFMPFWEKPPFFIWLQVLSMKLFGVNEFAARFPNAVCGMVTLLIIYYYGRKIVNDRMAIWWVLLYLATWLPHFYFKSGIIDPAYNMFIFLSFLQVHFLDQTGKPKYAAFAGFFLGLAVLTKGPVAALIMVLAFMTYVVMSRSIGRFKIIHVLLCAVVALCTTAIWFGTELLSHGPSFILEFMKYQVRLFSTGDAGHGQPFYYHFVILLLGCFPASVFLFQYGRKLQEERPSVSVFTRWMWIMFWVVLLLFSVVKTKIVHYSSLCYFPLTYLAALKLSELETGRVVVKKLVLILMLVIGSLMGIAITALPLIGLYKMQLIPYIKDPFAVGNLQANVLWSYTECLWGLSYLTGIWLCALLLRNRFRKGMLLLCLLHIVIIQVTVTHFVPKVEAYSQRAAIAYFKSFKGKDVYVYPLGYKSYAHLFYSGKQPSLIGTPDERQLLYGQLDKPAYFICKVNHADRYRQLAMLRETGSRNGFVFFERVR